MASSAPSREEFMENPAKYENFVLVIDEAGKFHIVSEAEARRRQDMQIISQMHDKKAGGFFNWIITYMSRAEKL